MAAVKERRQQRRSESRGGGANECRGGRVSEAAVKGSQKVKGPRRKQAQRDEDELG